MLWKGVSTSHVGYSCFFCAGRLTKCENLWLSPPPRHPIRGWRFRRGHRHPRWIPFRAPKDEIHDQNLAPQCVVPNWRNLSGNYFFFCARYFVIMTTKHTQHNTPNLTSDCLIPNRVATGHPERPVEPCPDNQNRASEPSGAVVLCGAK